MMRKFLSAVTIALGLTAGVAQAAPILFDFQNGANGANGTVASRTATQGGLSVTITGGTYNGVTDSVIDIDDRLVTKNNNGLGVDCIVQPLCANDIGLSLLVPDLLTLTFSQAVHFGAVFFTAIDRNDDFDLFIDGIRVLSDVTIQGSNPFDLTGYHGTSISFGADAANDNFRLGSFTVAAIPLPAGGFLLIGGLGALALLRRRRRAA